MRLWKSSAEGGCLGASDRRRLELMIYLDHAATSLPKPEPVVMAVTAAMNCLGNSGRELTVQVWEHPG